MDRTRVLVTGASGFIGRPIVSALLGAGYAVRAVTRRPVAFPPAVETKIMPDLRHPIDWASHLKGVRIVIHAAGLAHGYVTDDRYSEFDQVNWLGTQQLAQAAKVAGIERLVYISSVRAQVGAHAEHVVRETDEPQPTNYYGRSKLAAERAVAASGVPFTIFRPVVVYGPGAKGNMRTLVRLARISLPLPVASFSSRRSLLGIDNLTSAIVFALSTPATIGETYLIADPVPMTVGGILSILRAKQGRPLMTVRIAPGLIRVALMLIGRSDLWWRFTGDLIVDTSKFEALGWKPVKDTAHGLAEMLQAGDAEGAPQARQAL
jgi:UDP-glucose 4-epimerase